MAFVKKDENGKIFFFDNKKIDLPALLFICVIIVIVLFFLVSYARNKKLPFF